MIGPHQPVEASKERRLSRAALADESNALAIENRDGHSVEGQCAGEMLADVFRAERPRRDGRVRGPSLPLHPAKMRCLSRSGERQSERESVLDLVLRYSGRATHSLKSRPLQVVLAYAMTFRCTATGYDLQFRVFVPRTHPL